MALQVVVMHAPVARMVHERTLSMPAGSTVGDALQACGLLTPEGGIPAGFHLGVWGRKAAKGQALQEGDRIELVRDLRVDPKVARRQRFEGQGARGAGLFSRRRPGSKQGY